MRKKNLFLFLIASIFLIPSHAQQNPGIDSLLMILKNQKEDTSKVNTLNALSEKLWRRAKYLESKKYAQEALSLAEKIKLPDGSQGFKKGIATSYNSIGVIYNHWGNYPEALKNYLASLKIKEELGDKQGIANSFNNIGITYSDQGNYAEALKNHLASLKIRQEIGVKQGIAASFNNIGNVYGDQGNYPESLKNYLASLKIKEELGDKQGIAASFNNIGITYKLQGNYPEALKNYFASLKIFEEFGDKEGIADSYDNIGIVYKEQGNYPEALKNHLASLKISEEIGDKQGIGASYHNIGAIYQLQGNYPEALKNYFASLKIFKEIGGKQGIADSYIGLGDMNIKLNKPAEAKNYLEDGLFLSKQIGNKEDIQEAYKSLAELDSLQGNYKKAYEHHKMFILYRDSVINKDNNEKMVRQEMQYDFDKKEDSLKYRQTLTNEKLQQQTLLTHQQRLIKNYLIAGLVLFAVLSFFIYRNYQTRQQLKLQTLRNKIASDLHDDVGSTLSSISIFSQMAQQQSKEVIPLLETIEESSRKMLDAMADIVWTIKPENDQFEKIISRMRSFAYELLGARKIDFEFVADDDVVKMKLPMEVRKNLYLIFKEATNNMVKYANADKAMFAISEEKNNLTMLIRDNGKGFDTSQPTTGNGLKNMKKRADEIKGQLLIESSPGFGTTIQLNIAM